MRLCSLCVFLLMVLMFQQRCRSVSSLFIFLHCDNITHNTQAHTSTNTTNRQHRDTHNVRSLLSLDIIPTQHTDTQTLKKSPPRQLLHSSNFLLSTTASTNSATTTTTTAETHKAETFLTLCLLACLPSSSSLPPTTIAVIVCVWSACAAPLSLLDTVVVCRCLPWTRVAPRLRPSHSPSSLQPPLTQHPLPQPSRQSLAS